MPLNAPTSTGPLSPEDYLTHLRVAINPKRNRKLIEALRETCDAWTIDSPGADPCEPLVNKGRQTFEYPDDHWEEMGFELSVMLRSTVIEGSDLYMTPDQMTHDVAAYVGAMNLELAAKREPMHSTEPAVFLPLLVAARTDADPTAFRRYLLGWYDGPGGLHWNFDEYSPALGTNLSHTVALALALTSERDPAIGDRVPKIRGWLDHGKTNGTGRFVDIVHKDDRRHWHEIIAASADDAKSWAEAFLKA